jgi:hypothetical protein
LLVPSSRRSIRFDSMRRDRRSGGCNQFETLIQDGVRLARVALANWIHRTEMSDPRYSDSNSTRAFRRGIVLLRDR